METTQSTISSLIDKGKLFFKAVIIFVMAFFLWIPTNIIREVINEREARQKEAIEEVSNKWAGRQTITGPILMIPYNGTAANGLTPQKKYAWFLADQLDITSSVAPQKRHRGIYDVVVYQGDISITAKFNDIKLKQLPVPAENILWSEAKLVLQISDLSRGINEEIFIKWKDSSLLCQPWAEPTTDIGDAVYAAVPLRPEDANTQNVFTTKFSLHGSQQLMFSPAARETKIHMTGNWPDPSFTGIKIPETPNDSDSGINVNWKYLNRTTPMVWHEQFINLQTSSMGANLIIPVDGYDKTERSVKYALLCIILTFAAFFLIETIYKRNLHLLQYGLAGCALVLFYTLLLSISEYTGFNLAYLIAGVATIGLVTWFVGSIMKSGKLATFIGFVLTVVYGYIFTIIQLQDYSLLMGSIGLFVALAIIMYFSRKLQW
ncbi:MAG TPA: cell envelope integrity protein CreD [Chitinophagaceae bacterium]|nr:cell envelope integrity protein CreD [Chitinophagaceae bacterium]